MKKLLCVAPKVALLSVLMWAPQMVLVPQTALAQSLEFAGDSDSAPISIDAKGGIEWNQPAQLFIAAGPAKATRGDMVLEADELRAHYRSSKTSSNEVYLLDAIGNVRITSPGRVATGGKATYDVDKSVIVLKDANPVTLTAGEDVITAKVQLEFWDKRNLAVARGGAEVISAGKHIKADVLTAHFETNAAGKTILGRVEAFDNVVISTDTEQVFADRAAYNVPTGLARLTGSVKIKRGNNVINGCSADIDLNSGISRMNSCDGGSVSGTQGDPNAGSSNTGSGRVHGVLTPVKKKK